MTRTPGTNAAWCAEKASTIVGELAELVDLARELPPIQAEALRERIAPALFDALKLSAHHLGAEWRPEDRDRVMAGGAAAARLIVANYEQAGVSR